MADHMSVERMVIMAQVPVEPARPFRDPDDRDAEASAQRARLRRELGRLDTIFFLISAMVVVDTIGAIAVGGGQAFTWLILLFVLFFVPSALASAELGAALPAEGGAYVWVRTAFGRAAGALTSLLYWGRHPDVARRVGHCGGDVGLSAVRRRAVAGRPVRLRRDLRPAGHGGRRDPAALRQAGAHLGCDRADRVAHVLHRDGDRLRDAARRPAAQPDHLAARPDRRHEDGVHAVRRHGGGRRHADAGPGRARRWVR
jgi:hypothetical protein